MPAWFRIAPSADGMVVAGDFRVGVYTAIEELRSLIRRQTPIVFVAGNHEYYGECLPEQPAGAAAIADKHDVTFLENRAAVIQGVRFLGCTIWTDYALFGITARSSTMKTAGGDLNDHRLISMTTEPRQWFLPSHALAIHQASRQWLAHALATSFNGPTVVVTHHAPTPQSVHPMYADDPATPAFVSDPTDLVEASGVALWIHGHTHASFDYKVGKTRGLCNPKGYDREYLSFEANMVVEVERPVL